MVNCISDLKLCEYKKNILQEKNYLGLPAPQRVERLSERIAGLRRTSCRKFEVEEQLIQGGEFVNLLQYVLHGSVRLRTDIFSENCTDLEFIH